MPFIPHTPESLLRRSDSRNPATTCKGITTSGAHCRRSINSASSPLAHLPNRTSAPRTREGVLAVLEPGNSPDSEDGAAAFFCWQHKDQAAILAAVSPSGAGRQANIVDLQRRTSVDTLVSRLGVVDIVDHRDGRSRRERKKQWESKKLARKDTLPRNWQDVDGPLLAVHSDGKRNRVPGQPPRRVNQPSFLAALFCMVTPDIDRTPPARVHWDIEKPHRVENGPPITAPPPRAARNTIPKHSKAPPNSAPAPSSLTHKTTVTPSAIPLRPKLGRDPPSQTQDLLSLIPKMLSPQTTSLLLAELAKPVSTADEAGYIYMFWLTPNDSKPGDDTASTLLGEDNSPTTMPQVRRRNEVLQSHAGKSKTLLLKIGRAANVQRRMNQWMRQCGYELSLVRFYPYLPSAKVPSPLPSPRKGTPSLPAAGPSKVSHVHKVERLIHLELADKCVKRECDACGRMHKEWFEVEGTREGLRHVDGVVRRWVGWADGR